MARRLLGVIRPKLQRRDPDKERIALLAALLHDVGHGPFSHVFEHVVAAICAAERSSGGQKRRKKHEDWSAEIIQDKNTDIHKVLCEEGGNHLPVEVAALLKREEPKDIYEAIVASQFDADRLDYIQRDRMMTGVGFGHVDLTWLLDCLEVDTITTNAGDEVQHLCLNSKGVHVAEEYLEARFRLYLGVYMHKTTRAAEKMLVHLLTTAMHDTPIQDDPLLSYLHSKAPSIDAHLNLDDAVMLTTLARLFSVSSPCQVSDLARRLRNRCLYKCIDVSSLFRVDNLERRAERMNLYRAFKKNVQSERDCNILFDDNEIGGYKWYGYDERDDAHSKILVKPSSGQSPVDIYGESEIVRVLINRRIIERIYVSDETKKEEVKKRVDKEVTDVIRRREVSI